MLVKVIVKVGELAKTSRTTIKYGTDEVEVDVSSTFSVFCTQVETHVSLAVASYQPETVRLDDRVYVRPNRYASQKDLELLDAQNFVERIEAARAQFERRQTSAGSGSQLCELYVFVAKQGSTLGVTIRRATAPRIAEAATAIGHFLNAHPTIAVGEIAQTHWAVAHARQPEGAPVELPTTATFRQMQHIDAMSRSLSHEAQEPEFVTVDARLNGSTVLELAINVRQLRRVLGLPQHNLLADGIFSSFVPPAMPEEDVQDIDHESDRNDE